MKDIYELFAEGKSIVKECCGDVLEDISDVRVNYRSKKRWGVCKYNRIEMSNVIEISKRILEDSVPYEKTLQVMVHELLHATFGCHNHGSLWQKRAKMVMDKYPELKITRCNSSEEFGLEPYVPPKRKYIVECPCCKATWKRAKEVKLIKHPERYSCGKCHEPLTRIA